MSMVPHPAKAKQDPPDKTPEQLKDAAEHALTAAIATVMMTFLGTPAQIMRVLGKMLAEARYGEDTPEANEHNAKLLQECKELIRHEVDVELAKEKGAEA